MQQLLLDCIALLETHVDAAYRYSPSSVVCMSVT